MFEILNIMNKLNIFITRTTFFNEKTIKIPIFYNKKELIINCETNIPLQCIIKYRKNIIYTIDWIGNHQKPLEKFSYKTINNKIFIYSYEYYYKVLGTKTEKKLLFELNN